jgi:protein TonB
MADSRVTPVETESEIQIDKEPSSVDAPMTTIEDKPEPALDETPSATSSPSVIQDDPPVVPVPAAETESPIESVAEPVVPRTQRGDLENLSEVAQTPTPRDKPMPQYPPGARSTRQEGTVNLRLLVDERGRVEQVEIESGTKSRQLQRAATEAAKRWVYDPAIKDGVPVQVWITAAVTFKL